MKDNYEIIVKIDPETKINQEELFSINSPHQQPSKLLLDFLSLSVEDIAKLYCEKFENIKFDELIKILKYKPEYFFSSGPDLMKVTHNNEEKFCLIEVNSVATGCSGFPMKNNSEYNPYERMIRDSFAYLCENIPEEIGVIAILSDADYREITAYSLKLAEVFQETIYLVHLEDIEKAKSYYRMDGEYLEILIDSKWTKIRAAVKYVQDQPWIKMPIFSKTFIWNNLLACLCGGRNKSMANLAYKDLEEILPRGLKVEHPYTVSNLTKKEVLSLIKSRGIGVVKGLYSNSGREIFFLMTDKDIKEFEETEFEYDNFIYQDLIGHPNWFKNPLDRFCHVYDRVYDIRFVIAYCKEGFKTIAIHSRKARRPLNANFDEIDDFRSILLTNLAEKEGGPRMILYDEEGVKLLGMDKYDLAECYVQSVLATIAVDSFCKKMVKNGKFDFTSYSKFNPDIKIKEQLEEFNLKYKSL
jgi:hypothetical protein